MAPAAGYTSLAANSIFIKKKITCVALAAVFATTGVAFAFLTIGLGASYADNYDCENCCYDYNHCMSNLGYDCINGKCECDFSTMNMSSSLAVDNNTAQSSTLTICGAYNWTCTDSSDCRDNLGLMCNFSTSGRNAQGKCVCSPGYYYDYNVTRCLQVKTYAQPCSGAVAHECDASKGLVCNTQANFYACDCPVTSTTNMCDCSSYNFYNMSSSQCEPRKAYMEFCTGAYFDECDSWYIGLECDTSTNKCDCPTGYYYDSSIIECVPLKTYLQTCSVTSGFDNCDSSKNFYCNVNGAASSCNCPSTSNANTCDCQNGYYYSTANGTNACVPIGQYLEACVVTSGYDSCDTSKGLACNIGSSFYQCDCPTTSVVDTCDCPSGYFYSSFCISKYASTTSCTHDYECVSGACVSSQCL